MSSISNSSQIKGLVIMKFISNTIVVGHLSTDDKVVYKFFKNCNPIFPWTPMDVRVAVNMKFLNAPSKKSLYN